MTTLTPAEADAFVRSGAKEFRYGRDMRIGFDARNILVRAGVEVIFDDRSAAPVQTPTPEDEELFRSPEAERIKREICEMGRRMWLREYCEANGGNLSARIAPDRFLVTPTEVSKGFMTPEMLCLVDEKGRQLAGKYKRSSEIITHMAIYETTPEAMAVCHGHPCHAGAFALKQLRPPGRLIPELEIYVGEIAVTNYETPGSYEIADSIRSFAPQHQAILMGCHGLICWGKSVEDAYYKMEITDAYCRTLLLAQPLAGDASIPNSKMDELFDIKRPKKLPDNRYGINFQERPESNPWRELGGVSSGEMEEIVRRVTTEVLAAFVRKSE